MPAVFSFLAQGHLLLETGGDEARDDGRDEEEQKQDDVSCAGDMEGVSGLREKEIEKHQAEDRGPDPIGVAAGQNRREQNAQQKYHDDALAAYAEEADPHRAARCGGEDGDSFQELFKRFFPAKGLHSITP
jgi:hypothetical protein